MRRALLTTTAAIACLMLPPSVEARQHLARSRRAPASRRIAEPAISLLPRRSPHRLTMTKKTTMKRTTEETTGT